MDCLYNFAAATMRARYLGMQCIVAEEARENSAFSGYGFTTREDK
jgi:hypothetical protein